MPKWETRGEWSCIHMLEAFGKRASSLKLVIRGRMISAITSTIPAFQSLSPSLVLCAIADFVLPGSFFHLFSAARVTSAYRCVTDLVLWRVLLVEKARGEHIRRSKHGHNTTPNTSRLPCQLALRILPVRAHAQHGTQDSNQERIAEEDRVGLDLVLALASLDAALLFAFSASCLARIFLSSSSRSRRAACVSVLTDWDSKSEGTDETCGESTSTRLEVESSVWTTSGMAGARASSGL